MKLTTILLILALAGFGYFHQTKTAHLMAERDAAIASASKAKADRLSAETEAKVLRQRVAALEADRAAAATPAAPDEQTVRPTAPPPAPAPTAPAEPLAVTLNRLKATFDARAAEIDAQLTALARNAATSQSALTSLEAAPPTFHEQRTTDTGGKAGIRTSQADRDRVMADYQSRLNGYRAHLAAIAAEKNRLEMERANLGAAYQRAIDEARAAAEQQ